MEKLKNLEHFATSSRRNFYWIDQMENAASPRDDIRGVRCSDNSIIHVTSEMRNIVISAVND